MPFGATNFAIWKPLPLFGGLDSTVQFATHIMSKCRLLQNSEDWVMLREKKQSTNEVLKDGSLEPAPLQNTPLSLQDLNFCSPP